MADDYTPLLSDVREYVAAVKVFTEDEFDCAIRKVQAEAWDECHTATCPDLGDWRHACVNPYEEGATDE